MEYAVDRYVLGHEDSAQITKGVFLPVWCRGLRQRLVSCPLRSNASIRSQLGLGRRLGLDLRGSRMHQIYNIEWVFPRKAPIAEAAGGIGRDFVQ